MEEWREIVGSDGKYFVSNTGQIRSIARTIIRSDGKSLPVKEKVLKQASDLAGYKRTWIKDKGTVKLHREVALAFIPNPDNLPEVNHIDGNKANNRVENLEWVTHKQNAQHAHENGLVSHPFKLSKQDVIAIRSRYAPFSRTDGTCAIAEEYNMSPSYIWRIIANKKRKATERGD